MKTYDCYYYNKYKDDKPFSYCNKCKYANYTDNEQYLYPTVKRDIKDNMQCITYLEADDEGTNIQNKFPR